MIKDITVLTVGIGEISVSRDIDIEVAVTLNEAIDMIKYKFYDSVIVNFNLKDGVGAKITEFYPHYRTILLVDSEIDKETLKKYRNGFFTTIGNTFNIEYLIRDIVAKYPKKEQDGLIALLNIQGSINELKQSHAFIKAGFGEIHNRLENMHSIQKDLSNSFKEFKDQKSKTEQFYIDTLVDVKAKLNE